MEFTRTENLLQHGCDTLILGVFEENTLSASAQAVDQLSQGQLAKTMALAQFKGKENTSLSLYQVPGCKAERLLLIGLGKAEKLDFGKYKKACATAAQLLKSNGALKIGLTLPEVTVPHHNLYSKIRCAIETIDAALYCFDEFKSKASDEPKPEQTLVFQQETTTQGQVQQAIQHGAAIAESVKLTRDLGNTPPNVCTPEYLADAAKEVVKHLSHVHIHVISESELRDFEMGAYLAVAQGSSEDARMVVIEYHGAPNKHDKPLVLVGKGVTFDSGGLSLKPATSMVGMKYDMCGAASVLAVLKMAAELKLPINLTVIMACVENMPSGHATRPDDVVTTMSGKTVEIANTDAEGRLILCDALTYAQRYEPACLIDVATLTGAVIVALGRPASGLFANNQVLADELIAAGQASFDRVWQLPLWDDYQPLLDSKVADVCNIGGPEAGTITAACFLSRFVEEVPWAHLDVAGTAFNTGKEAAATGRPVPLLAQFVLTRAGVVPA
jgi:leucyl aminopeptidase